MMKIFAAGIVISTIALGTFAASAEQKQQTEPAAVASPAAPQASQEKTQMPAVKEENSAVKNCVDILAHKGDHTAAELAQCP